MRFVGARGCSEMNKTLNLCKRHLSGGGTCVPQVRRAKRGEDWAARGAAQEVSQLNGSSSNTCRDHSQDVALSPGTASVLAEAGRCPGNQEPAAAQ